MHKGKNKYVQAHSNASIVKYKLSSTNSQVQTLKYKLSSAKSHKYKTNRHFQLQKCKSHVIHSSQNFIESPNQSKHRQQTPA